MPGLIGAEEELADLSAPDTITCPEASMSNSELLCLLICVTHSRGCIKSICASYQGSMPCQKGRGTLSNLYLSGVSTYHSSP